MDKQLLYVGGGGVICVHMELDGVFIGLLIRSYWDVKFLTEVPDEIEKEAAGLALCGYHYHIYKEQMKQQVELSIRMNDAEHLHLRAQEMIHNFIKGSRT